ncbi:hypothetical protein [Sphingomonas sp. KR3-1]|uniref:hypothetical protein n=1 Tax=Sphingomonas sp. KR3-1 TaxID=3156611 RepID=UPI0032B4E3D2
MRDLDRRIEPRDGEIYARDWRTYHNYDFDRLERGQSTYFANRYYRDSRYYQPRTLTADDRVYRGSDRRYYCRREDGTTGLIAIRGSTLDTGLRKGGSGLLGELGGMGDAIARGRVTCR